MTKTVGYAVKVNDEILINTVSADDVDAMIKGTTAIWGLVLAGRPSNDAVRSQWYTMCGNADVQVSVVSVAIEEWRPAQVPPESIYGSDAWRAKILAPATAIKWAADQRGDPYDTIEFILAFNGFPDLSVDMLSPSCDYNSGQSC